MSLRFGSNFLKPLVSAPKYLNQILSRYIWEKPLHSTPNGSNFSIKKGRLTGLYSETQNVRDMTLHTDCRSNFKKNRYSILNSIVLTTFSHPFLNIPPTLWLVVRLSVSCTSQSWEV